MHQPPPMSVDPAVSPSAGTGEPTAPIEVGDALLRAAGLPDAWRGADAYTVLDLDFARGDGLLATLAAWHADPGRCGRLRVAVLVEAPVAPPRLRETLEVRHRGRPFVEALRDRWPPPLPGMHRIELAQGRVQVTLAVGPRRTLLPGWLPHADALLVTVHADDRVDRGLLRTAAACLTAQARVGIVSLPAPGDAAADRGRPGPPSTEPLAATLDALAGAGLHTTACRNDGSTAGSRRTLVALTGQRMHGPPARAIRPDARCAIVVGAGLAGCATAFALARRGWSVLRLDAAAAPAGGGSAQPVLAQHPSVSPDDAPLSRLTRAATLLTRAGYDEGCFRRHGRLQLMDAAEAEAAAARWPAEWVEALDAARASERAGVALRSGGLWLPLAGSADPTRVCEAWTIPGIVVRNAAGVARLERRDDGWRVLAFDGSTLGEAPHVVVATAGHDLLLGTRAGVAPTGLAPVFEAAGLRPLPGRTIVATLPTARMPRCTLGGQGHAVPIDGERLLLGPVGPHEGVATPDDPDAECALAWRRFTNKLLSPFQPPRIAPGRAGVRVATRDHLPLVGPMPAYASLGRSGARPREALPGLWLATAFAGRGLLWSVLAAEIIAASIEGEPAPLERSLADRLRPDRFLRRAPHARA